MSGHELTKLAALAVAVGIAMMLAVGVAVFAIVSLLERFMLRIIERTQNVLTTGRAEPPEAIVTREEDAESRVLRVISEETIRHGMQILRDQVYGPAGVAVEDDVLREEAIAMLNGIEPRIPKGIPQ